MGPAARLAEALDFAARAHVDQRRKGHRAEPYVNHLTDVTARLARSAHGDDIDLLVAGALHDTVEDTAITVGDLAELFGERVAALVLEVTDDKSLAVGERKRLQVEHAPDLSTGAKLIKLADKTSNLMSLATSPPAEWSPAELAGYVDWAEAVVAACRGLDAVLDAEYARVTALARLSLSQNDPLEEKQP